MLFDDVKRALRITHNSLDTEINDFIMSARIDMIQSGVSTIKVYEDTDVLIKRAIILYTKANFLADKDEAARFQASYNLLKIHLALASDYKEGV
ncbi:head-tail connector protein [Bacillus sp. BP-3]|uniref:head-tail connector protein n=1 Tax=Bacillus sp. BP-3 TaxID=3022773 RepID=UPI00232AF496|nr:head-tail connector protein [Bacillus sp. BP-3]MDC2866517.1 head-tail connector protein [Bacillus sp. BP-3]